MASLWLLILFLSSVLTNSATAWYVMHKHSIKRSLFFIIFLSAIVTSISSLVIFVVLAINVQNTFLCSCIAFGFCLSGISTVTLNAIAAHVRYINILPFIVIGIHISLTNFDHLNVCIVEKAFCKVHFEEDYPVLKNQFNSTLEVGRSTKLFLYLQELYSRKST